MEARHARRTLCAYLQLRMVPRRRCDRVRVLRWDSHNLGCACIRPAASTQTELFAFRSAIRHVLSGRALARFLVLPLWLLHMGRRLRHATQVHSTRTDQTCPKTGHLRRVRPRQPASCYGVPMGWGRSLGRRDWMQTSCAETRRGGARCLVLALREAAGHCV